MGSRDYSDIKEELKKKYGELFSISKVNSHNLCEFAYFLSYIMEQRGENNAYAIYGGVAHDVCEAFYKGEIAREDMLKVFMEKFIESKELENISFPFGDKEERKWFESVKHFMKYHEKIKYEKLEIEKLIFVLINNKCFQGYIDVLYKDSNGKVVILDWKTSSMFTGKKKRDAGRQLILYKLAVENTYKLKVDKLMWNMLKYCDIEYTVNNQLRFERGVLRCEAYKTIIDIMGARTKDSDFQINAMMFNPNTENWDIFKEYNDYNFKIVDCYLEYEADDEAVYECIEYLVKELEKIENKGRVGELFKANNKNSFFCNNLCNHSEKCKYIKK